MDEVDRIIKSNKEKRNIYTSEKKPKKELSNNIKYFRGLISRTLIAVIFVLGSVIITKVSDKNKMLYKKYVLENSLEFTKINNLYEKYFGNVDLTKKNNDTPVFFDTLNYSNKENYLDGEKFTLNKNEVIKAINGGIIVFIGSKEDYGNTIIIQGNDGVDIWYSGITNTDLKVYDYVSGGSILGNLEDDTLILTIQKDDQFIKYDEYKKNI